MTNETTLYFTDVEVSEMMTHRFGRTIEPLVEERLREQLLAGDQFFFEYHTAAIAKIDTSVSCDLMGFRVRVEYYVYPIVEAYKKLEEVTERLKEGL